jgi:hypothetical protein
MRRWWGAAQNYPLFRRQIQSILGSPDALSETEIEAMYALVCVNGGHRLAHELIGYINERYRFGNSRWMSMCYSLTLQSERRYLLTGL